MGSDEEMLTNPTRIHDDVGSIPGLAQWVKELAWLWLWCRPATAALIQPLSWEPSYAVSEALKGKKKKKKKRKKERKKRKGKKKERSPIITECNE